MEYEEAIKTSLFNSEGITANKASGSINEDKKIVARIMRENIKRREDERKEKEGKEERLREILERPLILCSIINRIMIQLTAKTEEELKNFKVVIAAKRKTQKLEIQVYPDSWIMPIFVNNVAIGTKDIPEIGSYTYIPLERLNDKEINKIEDWIRKNA